MFIAIALFLPPSVVDTIQVKHADISTLLEVTVGADGHAILSATGTTSEFDDIDLNCNGIAGNILDALAWAFKSKVVDALQAAIVKAMPELMATVNKKLDAINLDIPLDSHKFAEIRFDLSTEPTVAANYITVPTLGTVVPVANPAQVGELSCGH